MEMKTRRTLEIVFGVLALLAVVSIPIPKARQRTQGLGHPMMVPGINLQRLDELQRTTQAQRVQVHELTRITRELINARNQQHPPSAGVACVPAGTVGVENLRHE